MQIRILRNKISCSLYEIYSDVEANVIADWLIMATFRINEKIQFLYLLDKNVDENSVTYKIIVQKWKRLLRQEPLQYVLHKSWFYGIEFFVNRSTLIPRPETEEMCHYIIQTFTNYSDFSFVDIGTGSGCISIVLKKYFSLWNAVATDISTDALNVAKCNAKKHKVAINFLQDDIFQTKLTMLGLKFDLIVSNPPYIPYSEKEKIKPNVKNYEPHVALFVPDEEPLLFYKAICNIAKKVLKPKGFIIVEIHENFAAEVKKIFVQDSYEAKVIKDMQNKPRFLIANAI